MTSAKRQRRTVIINQGCGEASERDAALGLDTGQGKAKLISAKKGERNQMDAGKPMERQQAGKATDAGKAQGRNGEMSRESQHEPRQGEGSGL